MNNREWKKRRGEKETQASERKVRRSVCIFAFALSDKVQKVVCSTSKGRTQQTRTLPEVFANSAEACAKEGCTKRRTSKVEKKKRGKRREGKKDVLLTRLSVRCTCLLACQSTAQPRPPTPDLLRRAPAARPLRLAGTGPRRERHCHLDLRPNLHTGPAAAKCTHIRERR